MDNWFDYILFHARLQPEKPAMAMENRVVTYAMLKTAIDRCASRLVAADIGSGFVAVLVKNPIRHMALCLALYRIGVPSISLEHQQADIGGETFSAVIGDRNSQHLINSRNQFVEAADEWFSQDPPNRRALPPAFSDDSAICRASLTSGTTGTPKRISYSSTEIGERILIFLDVNWSLVLCMPGLSSNIGFKTACAALATGRTLCFAESPFQAIRMIELFSIDLVLASPEQVLALTRVARRTRAQVNSLRRLEIVGNRSTRTLLEAAAMYLCKDIQCRYATSETGVLARTWGREVLANPELAGEVLPGVEVGIFNDNGDRCDPGEMKSSNAGLRRGPRQALPLAANHGSILVTSAVSARMAGSTFSGARLIRRARRDGSPAPLRRLMRWSICSGSHGMLPTPPRSSLSMPRPKLRFGSVSSMATA